MSRTDSPIVIKTVGAMRRVRKELRGTVGFIPTMGYLHEGHLSLVRLAQKENKYVFVSIFVNEKQFNQKKDFQQYPRDVDKDLELLKTCNVDYVFLPSMEDMYPPHYATYVEVEGITNYLEGK